MATAGPAPGGWHRPVNRYAAAVLAAAVAAAVLWGQLRDPGRTALAWTGMTGGIGVAFTGLGALVLAGVPGHRVGRLMVAAGVSSLGALLAVSWTEWRPAAWVGQWLWLVPFGLILLALLVFPDGRLPSWRWSPVAALVILGVGGATVGFALLTLVPPHDQLLTGTPPTTAAGRTALSIANVSAILAILGAAGVLASLGRRWWTATGDTRRQLACLLPTLCVMALTIWLDSSWNVSGAWLLTVVAVPAGMTLAVLRYRLYGLDRVVNRTLVWLIMTVVVIAAFVALVSLLRWWFFGSDGSSEASLVATGLLAVTFQPARERVQRGVNQLIYGDRDDPYLVVRRLTGLLRDTAEPDAVPQLLTEALAASLRLPYVAVETAGRHAPRRLAFHGDLTFHGEKPDGAESFDMLAHGEHVGRLIVATRSPGARFTRGERRLFSDVALHAAVAVETARLIQDLRTSRERLVVAREEERRRLRRDLHDGLGPTIAGMSMQVSAAQRIVGRHERAGTILDELAGDLRTCTVEVRRLVDQLRPPALDRGLPAALRAEGRRFDGEELSVTVDAPDELDGLPAAVEVAAYRIVAEALTNVARHAHAARCTITVELSDALVLTVVDDGVGLPTAGRRGVGLDSMRERAEELGGTCALRTVAPHGTAVEVRMPLRLGVPVS
ncbi:hypothetical protein Val02_37520 [Virgisporangium aliadipatigenens]|uniref:Oxygen sensor histidine kinase NreB n=1 Tax=Virgisporangium aliadipatigenens TaxID=741659 RepID=A0A8J3YN42_9ACTN|nr:sensor histidine kinase [Virgisporangium aliadipatigenens]GIJ46866.1 hypothetical protein Val02_37520 [Virgisporangium aliadipatigenens]